MLIYLPIWLQAIYGHAHANAFLMLQMNAYLGCLGAFFGFFPWILHILGVTF